MKTRTYKKKDPSTIDKVTEDVKGLNTKIISRDLGSNKRQPTEIDLNGIDGV